MYSFIWEVVAIDVPMYVGRDCNLSNLLFGRGMAANGDLFIYLGRDGHQSAHSFGWGWPIIYPSIWEGIDLGANQLSGMGWLPIYPKGNGHLAFCSI